MTFGLSEKTLALIQDVFRQYPQITHVQIFGSRAMGNYRYNSDIDIVVRDEIDYRLIAKVAAELDELPLPYLFDVLCYPLITHGGLREHIDKYAQDIYVKPLC